MARLENLASRAKRFQQIANTWAKTHNINQLGGKVPTGKVIHKGIPDYTRTGWSCDRYLVVNDDTWLQLSDTGTDILASVEADYYGRIHWEDQCPNKH